MKTLLDAKRIEAILRSLRGGRVVVVGDVMLDDEEKILPYLDQKYGKSA